MNVDDFLFDGPSGSAPTLVLAHGAGAPMDSPFLAVMASGIADAGIRVARFEFPYMARRRGGRARGAPDRPPVLLDSWRAAIDTLGDAAGLVIGGKSLGGRIASMIADETGVAGLVCLGYPFHPPGQPERLRTSHLEELQTPTLIVQGTRDPFGTPDEVAGYALAPGIEVRWIEDGDHSFKPRVRSGRTLEQNLATAIELVIRFAQGR